MAKHHLFAEKIGAKRRAKLQLLEDGTLEGDVSVEYTGHFAFDRKEYDDDGSPAQREETLRDSVKARMSTAEVTNIKIENVTDPIKPYVYSYRIRVPGYGQRTGKRIFLQPGFFEQGSAVFSGRGPQTPVSFSLSLGGRGRDKQNFPAVTRSITPTRRYPLKRARSPLTTRTLATSTDGNCSLQTAAFLFGGGGTILVHRKFPAVKNLFDLVNKQITTPSIKQCRPRQKPTKHQRLRRVS